MGQEPSMEEILSSIKRIIAEDGDPPPAPRARGGLSKRIRPDPAQPPEGEPDEVLELTEAVDPEPVAVEPETEPEPQRLVSAAAETVPGPNLVSPRTEGASREALAQLSALIVKPDAPANTLEGLVTEMLRPMLKDWLDANLPDLVQTLVAKEISRISGKN